MLVKCKKAPTKEDWTSYCSVVALTRSFENPEAGKMVLADETSAVPQRARIFANEEGSTILVFWQTRGNELTCIWCKDRVWGKPEAICTLPQTCYRYTAAVSQEGNATISFADNKGEAYALFYEEDKWTGPIKISDSEYFVDAPKLAIDAESNTMFAWDLSNQDKDIAIAYRARNHVTVVPLFPHFPSGISAKPKVQSDGFGNFFVTWMGANVKKIEVYAAVYAIETGLWSEPVRLSTKGVICSDVNLAMNGCGKGIVAWLANYTILDRHVQVVEIDTQR